MEETTIPRNEIIQVADIVAREKSIDREIVFLQWKKQFKKLENLGMVSIVILRAHINRKNGAISLQRWTLVVEEVEDEATQISIESANFKGDNYSIGDYIKENLTTN